MASQVLMNISRDEHEQARLLSEYKYELDLQSKMVTAKREGIGIGMEKGKQERDQEILALWKSGVPAEEIFRNLEANKGV